MTMFHVMRPDGWYNTATYVGPLQFLAPPARVLGEIIGRGALVEHVTVLWHGRRAHMFVDDRGIEKGLPENPRASRVYWNATLTRLGADDLVYGDLERDPEIRFDDRAFVEPEVLKELDRLPKVFGTAVLWEGGYS